MQTLNPQRSAATVTRRELLGISAVWITMAAARPSGAAAPRTGGAPATANAGAEPSARFAYVGSFATSTRGAHGEGLSVYAIDAATSHWERVQLLSDVVNPGYLALDPRRPVLYAVQPVANDVSAFAIDNRTGTLTFINHQPSGGDDPSHLAIDPAGRFLVVANYVAGTVEVLPVNADGSLGTPTDVVATKGELGPHRTEQPGPHPHQCPFGPGGRFIVVPDKGLDRLFVFSIDAATGKLVPADPPFTKTRSGAGPRHIAFHPRLPYAWVINELDSTVGVYRLGQTGTLDADSDRAVVALVLHGQQYGRRDRRVTVRPVCVCFKPGARQRRYFPRRRVNWLSVARGLGAHAGLNATLHLPQSGRHTSFRRQPTQRLDCRVQYRSGDRSAQRHRAGHQGQHTGLHRVPLGKHDVSRTRGFAGGRETGAVCRVTCRLNGGSTGNPSGSSTSRRAWIGNGHRATCERTSRRLPHRVCCRSPVPGRVHRARHDRHPADHRHAPGHVAAESPAAGLQPPALIVVGEVVRLRDTLQWFEQTREGGADTGPALLPVTTRTATR